MLDILNTIDLQNLGLTAPGSGSGSGPSSTSLVLLADWRDFDPLLDFDFLSLHELRPLCDSLSDFDEFLENIFPELSLDADQYLLRAPCVSAGKARYLSKQ
jgi:hypothetical protein